MPLAPYPNLAFAAPCFFRGVKPKRMGKTYLSLLTFFIILSMVGARGHASSSNADSLLGPKVLELSVSEEGLQTHKKYELLSSRPRIDQVKAQAGEGLQPEWEYFKNGLLSMAAELFSFYDAKSSHYFFFARDALFIHDVTVLLGARLGVKPENIHILNVSDKNKNSLYLEQYINQAFRGVELADSASLVLVDTGLYGGLINKVKSKLPAHLKSRVKGHLIASKVMYYPSSMAMLLHFSPFENIGGKDAVFDSITSMEWQIPHFTSRAREFVKIGGKLEAVSELGKDLDGKVNSSLHLRLMQDLSHFAQQEQTLERFFNQLSYLSELKKILTTLRFEDSLSIKAQRQAILSLNKKSPFIDIPSIVQDAFILDWIEFMSIKKAVLFPDVSALLNHPEVFKHWIYDQRNWNAEEPRATKGEPLNTKKLSLALSEHDYAFVKNWLTQENVELLTDSQIGALLDLFDLQNKAGQSAFSEFLMRLSPRQLHLMAEFEFKEWLSRGNETHIKLFLHALIRRVHKEPEIKKAFFSINRAGFQSREFLTMNKIQMIYGHFIISQKDPSLKTDYVAHLVPFLPMPDAENLLINLLVKAAHNKDSPFVLSFIDVMYSSAQGLYYENVLSSILLNNSDSLVREKIFNQVFQMNFAGQFSLAVDSFLRTASMSEQEKMMELYLTRHARSVNYMVFDAFLRHFKWQELDFKKRQQYVHDFKSRLEINKRLLPEERSVLLANLNDSLNRASPRVRCEDLF